MSDRFGDTVTIAGHVVPGSWVHLLPEEAQWLRLPRERFAACSSCPPVELGRYSSACRCCGYLPQMTNFALGLALGGPSRDAVRAVIAAGHALPFGLHPSPRLFADAIAANAAGRFGQEPALACPFKHPDTHQCGVYPYRNSVCSTFFCHHDQGEAGEELWGLLQSVAGSAETAVAQWVMGQEGRSAQVVFDSMDALSPRVAGWVTGAPRWPEEALERLWGPHRGREEEFFVACADRVRSERDRLSEIARGWVHREPAVYEQALKDALPSASQDVFPQIDDGSVEREPLDELWYRLQLAERNLWSIPFGDRVRLASGATLGAEVCQDRLPILVGGARRLLVVPRPEAPALTLHPTPAEADVLRLFAVPCTLDAALLETPELRALDDPRAFLAEALQLGVLVPA